MPLVLVHYSGLDESERDEWIDITDERAQSRFARHKALSTAGGGDDSVWRVPQAVEACAPVVAAPWQGGRVIRTDGPQVQNKMYSGFSVASHVICSSIRNS